MATSVKVSKKMMQEASEARREALKKIGPMFPSDTGINIRPTVQNGQIYFELSINREVLVESRDIADCVRRARQHAEGQGFDPFAGAKGEKKKATPKPKEKSTKNFDAYMKLVKQVNAKLKDVEKTPEAIRAAASRHFNVDLTLVYLRSAPNPGIMKMRACNQIAAALNDKRRTK